MKEPIALEAEYPFPPERVWRALTEPEALSQWLLPTDFQPMIGFRFRLDRPGQEPISGKVLEVEEGTLLSYIWDDPEDGESLVVWRLDPTDGGTRVRIEHQVLETPPVTCLALNMYFNWRYKLRYSLPRLLRLLERVTA